jgi:hypothetical protein
MYMKIVPKTNADLAKEKKSQLSVFDQMKLNLTMVMTQYKGTNLNFYRYVRTNIWCLFMYVGACICAYLGISNEHNNSNTQVCVLMSIDSKAKM